MIASLAADHCRAETGAAAFPSQSPTQLARSSEVAARSAAQGDIVSGIRPDGLPDLSLSPTQNNSQNTNITMATRYGSQMRRQTHRDGGLYGAV